MTLIRGSAIDLLRANILGLATDFREREIMRETQRFDLVVGRGCVLIK